MPTLKHALRSVPLSRRRQLRSVLRWTLALLNAAGFSRSCYGPTPNAALLSIPRLDWLVPEDVKRATRQHRRAVLHQAALRAR